MRLPAAFERRDTVAVGPKGLQNPDRADGMAIRGFDTLSLRQTFKRALRPRLEIVHARLVPVGRMTTWANFRLSRRTLARHPFVLAPVTTIALLFDCDQSHAGTILSK